MSMIENTSSSFGREIAVEELYSKVAWRVLPLLIVIFVFASIDRFNVGFAKLTMLSDLGMSEAAYGFGAGIFFVGYLLFEIPSNLYLQKIGARKTIARITLLWGAVSMATAFVTSKEAFYVLRFLLGACEAGLYPGIILYFTYWFPSRKRAQMLGLFTTAVPIAGVIGGPLAGWILGATQTGPLGLSNWQWLFVLEGIPSVVLGLITWFSLIDRVEDAPWLSSSQKDRVLGDLKADREGGLSAESSFLSALKNPTFWLLTLVYFFLVSANPTLGFWGPSLVRDMGVSNPTIIGLMSAVPYIFGAAAMILVGRRSDRTGERYLHTASGTFVAALALVAIGMCSGTPWMAYIALVVAVAAVLSAFAPFWQIPSSLLSSAAAAGGIALINSIGNLSGFAGPAIVGWLKDLTGKASNGLYAVACMELLATLLILVIMQRNKIKVRLLKLS